MAVPCDGMLNAGTSKREGVGKFKQYTFKQIPLLNFCRYPFHLSFFFSGVSTNLSSSTGNTVSNEAVVRLYISKFPTDLLVDWSLKYLIFTKST